MHCLVRFKKNRTPTHQVKEKTLKNLRKLSTAVLLTLVLAVAAFAGEVNTPPCAPPDPGETQAPPCAAAQPSSDDSAAPGEMSTPPASNAVDILAVVDAAINLLLFF
jgi:hypothetical protein